MRLMKSSVFRLSLCAILLLGVSTLATAQSLPTVPTAQPFKIAVTHDGVDTTEYRLTIDPPGTAPNIAQTAPVSARDSATGDVIFDVSGQKITGAYSAVICARNVPPNMTPAEACTAAFPFAVATPTAPTPTAPTTIRIIGTIQIANGKPRPAVFEIAGIEVVTPIAIGSKK